MHTSSTDSHTPISAASIGIKTRHRSGTLPSLLSNSTQNTNADFRLRSSSILSNSNNNILDENLPAINIENIDNFDLLNLKNNNDLNYPSNNINNQNFQNLNLNLNLNQSINSNLNKLRSNSFSNNSNLFSNSIPEINDINNNNNTNNNTNNSNNNNNNSNSNNNNTLFATINENDNLNDLKNMNKSNFPLPNQSLLTPPSNNLRPRSQTYTAPILNSSSYSNQLSHNNSNSFNQLNQNQTLHQYPNNQNNLPQMTRASSFSVISSNQKNLNSFIPILQDHIPENSISLTSSHTNPKLGNTNTLLFINLPNDPNITNSNNFYNLLKPFGLILSIRVINCNDSNDLVVIAEFSDIESSIKCRICLNNHELYPGIKCCILFAKILDFNSNSNSTIIPNVSPNSHVKSNPIDMLNFQINSLNQNSNILVPPSIHQQNLIHSNSNPDIHSNSHSHSHSHSHSKSISHLDDILPFKVTSINDQLLRFKKIYNHILISFPDLLNLTELNKANKLINESVNYYKIKVDHLGPLPPSSNSIKKFDNPSLREIRKQLDQNIFTDLQIEELALSMNDELSELASDYLGNTIVQKFLDIVSPVVREDIIKILVPYLSQMSAHKNGTWAAQKLINTVASCNSNSKYPGSLREMKLVSESLKPFTTQLFNDTYANYVIHGVLKFKYPYSNFIFESLLSCFLEISFNRFGARAVRTCLESIESNKEIGKEIIILIINSILTWCFELMSDVNGSLLITWFLETCQIIDNKHFLLAYVLVNNEKFENKEIKEELNIETNIGNDKEEEKEKREEKEGEEKEEKQEENNDEIKSCDLNSSDACNKNEKFIKLCTLKLGSLSVLKILNYRANLEPRNLILKKIFGNGILEDELNEADYENTNLNHENINNEDYLILKNILSEGFKLNDNHSGGNSLNNCNSSHGCNFIHKILSIPTLDVILKKKIIIKIKFVLTNIINETGNITNNSMKRLCEECGIRSFNNVNLSANGSTNHFMRSSLANLGWGSSRSRSNSTNTNGSIDYDLLLRQQLDDLSLSNNINNNTNNLNLVSLNNGINSNCNSNLNINNMNNMNMNNMNNINMNNLNSINNMNNMSNMNSMNNMNNMNINMNMLNPNFNLNGMNGNVMNGMNLGANNLNNNYGN